MLKSRFVEGFFRCPASCCGLLLLLAATSFAAVHPIEEESGLVQPTLTGHWEGFIELPSQQLVIRLDFARSEGEELTGTIDIPEQGASALPLEEVGLEGSTASFAIAAIPGSPRFEGNWDGESWSGWFSQAGVRFRFEMGRAAVEPVKALRPQEPVEPFPYRSIDAEFSHGELTFTGTLTVPDGSGPFPAAVLLSGSGAQDRDSTLLGHKPFLLWADFLTRSGIAVLRFDDRGVGGSSGSVAQSTSADFAEDAVAAVEWLRRRSEVREDSIGLIGHSEGAIVAPMAAGMSDHVAFVVNLAGPAVEGHLLLERQIEAVLQASGASQQAVELEISTVRSLHQILRSGRSEDVRRREVTLALAKKMKLAVSETQDRVTVDPTAQASLDAAVEQFMSPWFGFFLAHDPGPSLRALAVPVLALYGEKDLQVLEDQNLPAIREALSLAPSQDTTVVSLEGLNHLLQESETGLPAEYNRLEQTVSPKALSFVGDWIVSRFSLADR